LYTEFVYISGMAEETLIVSTRVTPATVAAIDACCQQISLAKSPGLEHRPISRAELLNIWIADCIAAHNSSVKESVSSVDYRRLFELEMEMEHLARRTEESLSEILAFLRGLPFDRFHSVVANIYERSGRFAGLFSFRLIDRMVSVTQQIRLSLYSQKDFSGWDNDELPDLRLILKNFGFFVFDGKVITEENDIPTEDQMRIAMERRKTERGSPKKGKPHA
jgi:hypothetical protein